MSTPKSLFGSTRLIPGPDRTKDYEVEGTALLVALAEGVDGTAMKVGTVVVPYHATTSTMLSAGATLTQTHPLHKVQGNAGAVTIAGIAPGSKNGQVLSLRGDHASNFVTIQDDAANVKLIGGDITLRQYESIDLRWDSTPAKWVEVARATYNRLTNQAALELYESRANGANRIALRAPSSLAGDLTFTLPAVNAAGVLTNDGAGVLTWQAGTSAEENIVSHGAVGDDGTDNTAAIVAAYNALPAAGGTIRVPLGIFRMQYSALFIWKSNVAILFDRGGVLKGIAATDPGALINVGDATHPVEGFLIRGGEINGNAAACTLTASANGHAVDLYNVKRAWITENYFHDMPGDFVRFNYGTESNLTSEVWVYTNDFHTAYRNGVSCAGHRIFVIDNIIDGFNTMAVSVEPDNTGETYKSIIVQKNFIFPNATWLNTNNTNRQHGIAAHHVTADDTHFINVSICDNFIFGVTDGGLQYPTRGVKIQNFRAFTVARNHIYKTSDGIQAASGSSEAGSSGKITENHVWGASSVGIEALYCAVVSSNVAEFCGGAGISCYGKKISVAANICRNNGQDAALAYRFGLWLRDGSGEVTVIGNLCFDDQVSPTQQYGCRIDSGVGKCRIALNDFYPNAVDGVSDVSGLTTNDIFLNRGAASFLTNAEFVQDTLRIYQGALAVACLKLEPAGDTAKGIVIVKAGTGAGALIDLTNSGTGNDITGNLAFWYITKGGEFHGVKGVFSGDVSGAKGTFADDVAGVKATFSDNLTAVKGDFSGDITAAGGFRTSLAFYRDVPGDSSPHDAWYHVSGLGDGDERNCFLATRPGSILRLSIRSSDPRTAGTLTATVAKNGTQVALAASIDAAHVSYNDNAVAKDAIAFVAGDLISVQNESASFANGGGRMSFTVEIEV